MSAGVTPETQSLLGLLEQHMAEVADVLGQIKSAGDLESQALSEVLEALSKRQSIDWGPLIAALQAIKPTITVNVPAPVVHVSQQAAAKWRLSSTDASGQVTRTVTLERVA